MGASLYTALKGMNNGERVNSVIHRASRFAKLKIALSAVEKEEEEREREREREKER